MCASASLLSWTLCFVWCRLHNLVVSNIDVPKMAAEWTSGRLSDDTHDCGSSREHRRELRHHDNLAGLCRGKYAPLPCASVWLSGAELLGRRRWPGCWICVHSRYWSRTISHPWKFLGRHHPVTTLGDHTAESDRQHPPRLARCSAKHGTLHAGPYSRGSGSDHFPRAGGRPGIYQKPGYQRRGLLQRERRASLCKSNPSNELHRTARYCHPAGVPHDHVWPNNAQATRRVDTADGHGRAIHAWGDREASPKYCVPMLLAWQTTDRPWRG